MNERVLCVDDEPKVLSAFQRQLSEHFEMVTATSGGQGLEALAAHGPFAVIVSDMRMPGMDGVQFLAAARKQAPDSVRIMLTGNADQQTAANAVNEGHIFRFLTKPCTPEALLGALQAAVTQYRLVTAERVLLERTLRGAIKILNEVLSLTNPVAFGRASRVQRLVTKLCRHMQVEPAWPVEIAAMLSQIGCVTIPADTLDRAQRGGALQPSETQMLDAHPQIAAELIRHIPRLEEVARIVAYQKKGFDGSGLPRDFVQGASIPSGARILRVALDHDALKWRGRTDHAALLELRKRPAPYDPAVLQALGALCPVDAQVDVRECGLHEVEKHAILADDVRTPEGRLLIGKGQELTPSVHQLLCNYARGHNLEKDLRVRVYADKAHTPIEHSATQGN